MNTLVSAIF